MVSPHYVSAYVLTCNYFNSKDYHIYCTDMVSPLYVSYHVFKIINSTKCDITMIQRYDFSPKCINICCFKMLYLVYTLSHKLHALLLIFFGKDHCITITSRSRFIDIADILHNSGSSSVSKSVSTIDYILGKKIMNLHFLHHNGKYIFLVKKLSHWLLRHCFTPLCVNDVNFFTALS